MYPWQDEFSAIFVQRRKEEAICLIKLQPFYEVDTRAGIKLTKQQVLMLRESGD